MGSSRTANVNWPQLSEDANSANDSIREIAVNKARAALKRHLKSLGCPVIKKKFFDTVFLAATMGHIPGALLIYFQDGVNERNASSHSGAANVPISAASAARIVESCRLACDVSGILNEPVQTIQPNTQQDCKLRSALEAVHSSVTAERQVALCKVIDVLDEHDKRTIHLNSWEAALKRASDELISGSLAARLVLATRLRHNIVNDLGYPYTDDDLVDGVSAVCALFGIVSATVPAAHPGGASIAPSQDYKAGQAASDTSSRDTNTDSRNAVCAGDPRSTVDASRPGGYWVILEGNNDRPYYQDYDKSGPITRTELRGAADLEVIKALPSVVFDVEFANGIPYLKATADAIDLVIDGIVLRNGERKEITDSLAQLKVGNLPPLKIRRVWHVPQ